MSNRGHNWNGHGHGHRNHDDDCDDNGNGGGHNPPPAPTTPPAPQPATTVIYGLDGPGDTLFGNAFDHETFYGRRGNDNIFAGNGNDVLVGGLGADYLDGGNGHDIFRFGERDSGPGGVDRIAANFLQGEDTIIINFRDNDIDFDDATFTDKGRYDEIRFDNYNAAGDDFILRVLGDRTFTEADFSIV